MSRIQLAPLAAMTLLASFGLACGDGSSKNLGVVDDLPTVPPKQTTDTLEYEFAEQVIPPGKDVQMCQFLDVTTEDMYVKAFRSFQGKHGHHLILFSALIHDDVGTVRDCSSAEDMVRFRPIVSSERFGYEQFPDGMAVKVRAGTQMVMQLHYVNTTENDLRVRDVVHITPAKVDDVDTLVGFMGLSDITFEMQPSPERQQMQFDCFVPFTTNLLVLGPHMHEWGVDFKTEIGPAAGPMQAMIDIPVWDAEFRDKPPLLKYGKADAPVLREGDVIRTTCGFKNNRADSLEFPEEMCATFGYYFPAPDGGEEIICAGDES